ncbi:MAG: diacylglycerol kinase family protein [Verrucomicrobiaceae bacterium]|nr:diacylglycerol kinase family protein [Verrucomicrobiaceae bacterium]
MKSSPSSSLHAFLRGFGHAFRGIGIALRTQRNLRIHAVALMTVIALGWELQIAIWEWCAVILASGLVWTAELANTALEWLADRVSREREDAIRDIKDAAAAAVLVASIAASAIGALVFLPRLFSF